MIPSTLERHLPEQLSLLGPDSALDHIDIAAIAVDDLRAIAPDAPKPTFAASRTVTRNRFPAETGQRTGRVTGADHTDISLYVILQAGRGGTASAEAGM